MTKPEKRCQVEGEEIQQLPVTYEPRKRARRKGKLSLIVDMPVDILVEIFQHMQPADLLHAARTTKALRNIIMSRSSKSIWEASFATDPDIPKCPPDIPYPEWTNLLFDQYCHVCMTTRVKTPEWKLRIRLCKTCSNIALGYGLFYGEVYIHDLVNYIRNAVHDAIFLISEAELVISTYNSMKSDENELEVFCAERKVIVQRQIESALECELWAKRKATERSIELITVRQKRRADIIARLTAAGWEEEIKHLRDSISNDSRRFRKHRLVNKTAPLTERAWNRIEKEMIAFMQDCKDHRLAEEERKRTECERKRAEEERRHAEEEEKKAHALARQQAELQRLEQLDLERELGPWYRNNFEREEPQRSHAAEQVDIDGQRYACTACATQRETGVWVIPCMNKTSAERHAHACHSDLPEDSFVVALSDNCANTVRVAEVRYLHLDGLSSGISVTMRMEFVKIDGLYHPDVLVCNGHELTMRGAVDVPSIYALWTK